MITLVFPGSPGTTALVMLGLFWLAGTGLFVPLLFARRDEGQDKLPARFEGYRATSTYRPVQPVPPAHRLRRPPVTGPGSFGGRR